MLTLKRRVLVVDIKQGSRTDRYNPIELGSFPFALDVIERHCPNDGQWKPICKTLQNVGEVEIQVRRLPVDRGYIQTKKKEVIAALEKQVEAIQTLNKNPKFILENELTGNVKGMGGVSLLHAATELFDCESVVKKLLILQADPNSPSESHGTPLDIANGHYQRALKKETDRRMMGCPSCVIDQYRERSEKARRLLKLLSSKKKQQEGEIMYLRD
jgi:hypothetical protein